jgi:hypothetical protein
MYNEKVQQIQNEKSEKNTCESSKSISNKNNELEYLLQQNYSSSLLSNTHLNQQHLRLTDSAKSISNAAGLLQSLQTKTPKMNFGTATE